MYGISIINTIIQHMIMTVIIIIITNTKIIVILKIFHLF